MLVLTGRVAEKFFLSGGITVEIVEIRGGKVRLGFTAPPEVEINREKIQREKDNWKRWEGGAA